MGYLDAGYLSDRRNARSQTGYVFLYGGTVSQADSLATEYACAVPHKQTLAPLSMHTGPHKPTSNESRRVLPHGQL